MPNATVTRPVGVRECAGACTARTRTSQRRRLTANDHVLRARYGGCSNSKPMRTKFVLSLLAVPFAVGCSSSSPQVLTGRVAPGFPTQVTGVKVMQGTTTVASAKVATNGSFTLSVPPSSGLTLRLVGGGQSNVIFPRHSGSLARTFVVRGGGVAFDLGAVHFVGASSSTTFAFHDASSSSDCDAEDHDTSGSTCVDDGDHGGGSCEAADDSGGSDGSGASDGSDGSDGSGSGEVDIADGPDQGDSVADHNFPADGCADGQDNGGDAEGGGSGS